MYLDNILRKRADLETIVGRRVWTSISVQNLFVPVSALQSRLSIFCQNLVVYTHVPGYEIQLIGSAAGMNYRGHKLLICTKHQIKGKTAEDVGIILTGKNKYISSAGFAHYLTQTRPLASDAQDLYVFDFAQQAVGHPDLGQRFFRLRTGDFLSDEHDVVAYIAYGSPFSDQKYDVVDANHIGMVTRSIICEPRRQPSDLALSACEPVSPIDFDPNGLSGGPVFAVVVEGAGFVLKFAGIINRAGSTRIHFIKASVVQRFLNLFCETDT